MTRFTLASIPDQTGHGAIVTGASSGIGAVAAEALAAQGAHVILAARDQARGDAVRTHILAKHRSADVEVSLLDMADLASIHAFADRVLATHTGIDILIANAGLGMQRKRAVTVDGFERQFGTNHLGHFALTGLLLPALLKAPAARVVSIASIAHRTGKIDFDDLQGEKHYKGGKAYNQSKLANMMFAFELDRRARAAGVPLMAVAAHPGVSSTGFIAAIGLPGYQQAVGEAVMRIVGQDAVHGALPGVYAATMPKVRGGDYWGPDGVLELKGMPRLAKIAPQALDRATWKRLWSVSEELTGVTYGLLDEAAA